MIYLVYHLYAFPCSPLNLAHSEIDLRDVALTCRSSSFASSPLRHLFRSHHMAFPLQNHLLFTSFVSSVPSKTAPKQLSQAAGLFSSPRPAGRGPRPPPPPSPSRPAPPRSRDASRDARSFSAPGPSLEPPEQRGVHGLRVLVVQQVATCGESDTP